MIARTAFTSTPLLIFLLVVALAACSLPFSCRGFPSSPAKTRPGFSPALHLLDDCNIRRHGPVLLHALALGSRPAIAASTTVTLLCFCRALLARRGGSGKGAIKHGKVQEIRKRLSVPD